MSHPSSVKELQQQVRSAEQELAARERELEARRQKARALNEGLANQRRALDEGIAAASETQKDLRDATRDRQVLEQEKRAYDGGSWHHTTREDYVSQLIDAEGTRKTLDAEISDLAEQVNELTEKRAEAQKRLTVVRLMSLLDDLQTSLNAKVNTPGDEDESEEARAQELLKAIQELSRDRERALMHLSKKETEVTQAVELKKKRIEELRIEADRNRSVLRDGNDAEVYGVVNRIQKERRTLWSDIERLEETNEQLERVLLDTKYTAGSGAADRKAALGADDTMGTSRDPEEEKQELRERITAANAERRRYELKTEAIQKKTDEEAARYDTKMSELLREILMYEEENKRLKKGNMDLKATCDAIAGAMDA